jgi:hypothetical protein
MSMLRFFTMLMAFLFSVPALAAERVALVVGNSSYEFVPALDNPINDAKLMAETLRGLGFTLVGDAAQLNLDKAAFDKAVQEFGTNCKAPMSVCSITRDMACRCAAPTISCPSTPIRARPMRAAAVPAP